MNLQINGKRSWECDASHSIGTKLRIFLSAN